MYVEEFAGCQTHGAFSSYEGAEDRPVRGRATAIAAVAALVVYAVVMLWPYLVAALVRGAAVTAWTNIATAPIQGRAAARLPPPGTTVGSDSVLMEIVNDRLDYGRSSSRKRASSAPRLPLPRRWAFSRRCRSSTAIAERS